MTNQSMPPGPETEAKPDLGVIDAYTPAQMARRVETAGVAKAGLPLVPLFALAVLAGAFIAFGAMFYTVANRTFPECLPIVSYGINNYRYSIGL